MKVKETAIMTYILSLALLACQLYVRNHRNDPAIEQNIETRRRDAILNERMPMEPSFASTRNFFVADVFLLTDIRPKTDN
jgi:hypothetical protein